MTRTAAQAEAQMRAMIATRTLVQVVEDMRVIDQRIAEKFTAELSLVHSFYVEAVEAQWPALAERAWAIIETLFEEGKDATFCEAMTLAIEEAVA